MTETLKINPETIKQHAVDEALIAAREAVAYSLSEPEFQIFLTRGHEAVDINNVDEYRAALANYAPVYLSNHEQMSELEKDSYALVAHLPLALTKQYDLNHRAANMSDNQKNRARRSLCTYNSLLRHFVTSYPQSSDQLHYNLLSATLQIVGGESTEFLQEADRTIKERLKGIKHELGFAQMLDAFGLTYREGAIDEDLNGRDFIVDIDGTEIGIDVKASLDKVDEKNKASRNTPVAIKPNGDIVMYTLLTDSDFDDGFLLSPSVLNEKSIVVAGYLQGAIRQSLAKK